MRDQFSINKKIMNKNKEKQLNTTIENWKIFAGTGWIVALVLVVTLCSVPRRAIKPTNVYGPAAPVVQIVTNTVVQTTYKTNLVYVAAPNTNRWYDCFKYHPLSVKK